MKLEILCDYCFRLFHPIVIHFFVKIMQHILKADSYLFKSVFFFSSVPVSSKDSEFLSGQTNYQVTQERLMSLLHVHTFSLCHLLWHTEGVFNCVLAVLQGEVDLMASLSASICPEELWFHIMYCWVLITSRDSAVGMIELHPAGFLYSWHAPVWLSLHFVLVYFFSGFIRSCRDLHLMRTGC